MTAPLPQFAKDAAVKYRGDHVSDQNQTKTTHLMAERYALCSSTVCLVQDSEVFYFVQTPAGCNASHS
jgi:hypothetical protein